MPLEPVVCLIGFPVGGRSDRRCTARCRCHWGLSRSAERRGTSRRTHWVQARQLQVGTGDVTLPWLLVVRRVTRYVPWAGPACKWLWFLLFFVSRALAGDYVYVRVAMRDVLVQDYSYDDCEQSTAPTENHEAVAADTRSWAAACTMAWGRRHEPWFPRLHRKQKRCPSQTTTSTCSSPEFEPWAYFFSTVILGRALYCHCTPYRC